MLKEIVSLGRDSAIDAIKNEKQVMWKSGVWNKYQLGDTQTVIDRIRNSSYGADVDEDEKGMKYVSMPCASDMW